MKNISAAFVKAQKAFGPALKTHTNPAFRSKYADLSACVEAVMDALNANGIALMQHSHDVESGVTVETVFVHESGEVLSSGKLHVPAAKQDPQGYGSAMTYARRYSLMAACGIAPEDDDGNAASKATAAQADDEARARAERRSNWLADQQAAIDAASTAGELKRIVADAIGIATQERDDPAIMQINKWAAAKVAKAKPKRPEVSEMATA
jgi:hypothetical protein